MSLTTVLFLAGFAFACIGARNEVQGIIRGGGCRLWAVDEADTPGIVRAFTQILREYGRYREQGQQNFEARRPFTREGMARKIEAVLAEAIAAGPRRGRHDR
jgi:hypothetical protein